MRTTDWLDTGSRDDERGEATAAGDVPAPLGEQIAALLREGRFCEAARLYSEATGQDLLESKLAIDRLARRHGLAPVRGCASHFVLLAGLGIAGTWGVLRLVAEWV